MPLGATVCVQEGQLPADAHSLYLSNEGNTPKAEKCRAGEQSALLLLPALEFHAQQEPPGSLPT